MKVKFMKAKDIMYSKTVQIPVIENYKTYWTLPHPKVSTCLTHLGIGVPVTRIVFGWGVGGDWAWAELTGN